MFRFVNISCLFSVCFVLLLFFITQSARGVDYGAIRPGQTRSGEITIPSPNDSFTFYGNEGDCVIITMSVTSGDLGPKIVLYDPDGIKEEDQATLGESVQIADYRLLKTGMYTIICSDILQSQTGKYKLSLNKIPGNPLWWDDPDGGEIESGKTSGGQIAHVSSADCFRFTGTQGNTVVITMTNTSGELGPKIVLYDPDGIGEADDATLGESAQISDHQLLKTGTYTVVCSDLLDTTTGTYNLSLTKIPPSDLGLVAPLPNDGEDAAPILPTMEWDSVPGANSYDVYFGAEEPLIRLADNIKTTSFDTTATLYTDHTYLWYIVAHRGENDLKGPMYIFKTAKGTQPPSQPQGELTLAYVLTVPSIDPDGNPVTYTAEWESDTGDNITHQGLIPVRGKLVDIMEETDKLESGQTWTITVTPNDGVEDGPPSVESIRWQNLGGYMDINNDGIVDVADVVSLVKLLNGVIP